MSLISSKRPARSKLSAFDQSAPIAERMEEATSHLTKLMVGASSDDWELARRHCQAM